MRYAQLATQLLTLEQQLVTLYAQRRSAKDPAALAGIVEQIETISTEVAQISTEIRELINAGNVTAVDITAAHARNQQVPVGTAPPPPLPDNVRGTWYPEPSLTDQELRTLFRRGLKYRSTDGKFWLVAAISDPVVTTDPNGEPAIANGPF